MRKYRWFCCKNSARDNWGHYAVTLVDALSTLHIMGLHKEFREGVNFLDENLDSLISTKYVFLNKILQQNKNDLVQNVFCDTDFLIFEMNRKGGTQSLFELNIRLLGGLNSAHSLCLVSKHFSWND